MTNPYPPQPPQRYITPIDTPLPPYYPQPPMRRYPPPLAYPYYYQQPQPPAPRYVDGMSTGAHIRNVLLSIVTCGLWIPIYVATYYLSRHRIT